MATAKPRSLIIQPTETVRLTMQFRNGSGTPIDADTVPQITIVQPDGNVLLGPTSAGVFKIDTGLYGFDLEIEYIGPVGIWNDRWNGSVSGSNVYLESQFAVYTTQMPAINTDGYVHLGDDVGFDYSQTEIKNINAVTKALKARLKSSGKTRMKDQFGNMVYGDCDVYTVDQLTTFVVQSLSSFNQIPHFTGFTWADTEFVKIFFDVLVQGALLYALASQALIERGIEFTITDNGTGFTPPSMADMLNTQYSSELNDYKEKVKQIKASMKPAPMGLGSLRMEVNPAIMRLRHRRAGRLI